MSAPPAAAGAEKLPIGVGRVPMWWMECTPHYVFDVEENAARRQLEAQMTFYFTELAAAYEAGVVGPNGEAILGPDGKPLPWYGSRWNGRSQNGAGGGDGGGAQPATGRQFKIDPKLFGIKESDPDYQAYLTGAKLPPGFLEKMREKFGTGDRDNIMNNLHQTDYGRYGRQAEKPGFKPVWADGKKKLRPTSAGQRIQNGQYDDSPNKFVRRAQAADANEERYHRPIPSSPTRTVNRQYSPKLAEVHHYNLKPPGAYTPPKTPPRSRHKSASAAIVSANSPRPPEERPNQPQPPIFKTPVRKYSLHSKESNQSQSVAPPKEQQQQSNVPASAVWTSADNASVKHAEEVQNQQLPPANTPVRQVHPAPMVEANKPLRAAVATTTPLKNHQQPVVVSEPAELQQQQPPTVAPVHPTESSPQGNIPTTPPPAVAASPPENEMAVTPENAPEESLDQRSIPSPPRTVAATAPPAPIASLPEKEMPVVPNNPPGLPPPPTIPSSMPPAEVAATPAAPMTGPPKKVMTVNSERSSSIPTSISVSVSIPAARTQPEPIPVQPMVASRVAPAPHDAHKPVPVVAHKPEPVVAHKPEPVVAHRPEPVVAHRPEPVVAHRPEPVLAHKPEPVVVPRTEPVVVPKPDHVVAQEITEPVPPRAAESAPTQLLVSQEQSSEFEEEIVEYVEGEDELYEEEIIEEYYDEEEEEDDDLDDLQAILAAKQAELARLQAQLQA